MWQILQLLFPRLLFFPPPQKWMNLISNRLSTVSMKYKNWPSPVFGQFQNGCNKVVTEPCVVQFWSEIILVISNSAYDLSQNCTPLSLVTIINTQCGIWIVKARVVLKLFYRLHFVLFFSSKGNGMCTKSPTYQGHPSFDVVLHSLRNQVTFLVLLGKFPMECWKWYGIAFVLLYFANYWSKKARHSLSQSNAKLIPIIGFSFAIIVTWCPRFPALQVVRLFYFESLLALKGLFLPSD